MRRLVPLALLVTVAACPAYNPEPYLTDESGLMDADEWAKYGTEQAMAVAIGREFGQHDAAAAAEYGRKFAPVDSITVDSLGSRLVVHFRSGWDAQVTPISDGKSGSDTPGL